MYEILIVKPSFFRKGIEVGPKILELDMPDRLWWFEGPYTRLKAGFVPDADEGFIFACDAIMFQFDFCPNPEASHFDRSALYSELIQGQMLHELLVEDMPKFAQIVKNRVAAAPEYWPLYDTFLYFYALYKVETWEHRDEDGGLGDISVELEFMGELDFERLHEIVVGQKRDTTYEPNTRHWQKGDLVIHDGDAKEARMLMRVIGYSREGLVKTQYVDPKRTRKVWKNETRFLHDPARFGIYQAMLAASSN